MPVVVPTRSELLDRRRRVTVAQQGRDPLQDKRTALVRACASRQEAARVAGEA